MDGERCDFIILIFSSLHSARVVVRVLTHWTTLEDEDEVVQEVEVEMVKEVALFFDHLFNLRFYFII